MKKKLSAILIILDVIFLSKSLRVDCFARPPAADSLAMTNTPVIARSDPERSEGERRSNLNNAIELLKARKDREAAAAFEEILRQEPQNPQALWGKAELLRRSRRFSESEAVLNKIFSENPDNPSALITLAYIRYMQDNFKEALKCVSRVLKLKNLERENRALAYMMLGTINSGRSSKGWILKKLNYGMKIQSYFLKARELAPELPEVRLGLGVFYLKAPALIGGDIDKAIKELESALKLTPDFATANARLAQAYKKKGNLEKYSFYLQKAAQLDPGNEVLIEIASSPSLRSGSSQ